MTGRVQHPLRAAAALASVVVITWASGARAQSTSSHAGVAETKADTLFREGTERYDAGEIAAACAAFAESLKLDPKLGTLLNLALCHERQGKTATAWAEYKHGAVWATQNGQDDRKRFANERATELEGKLPRILLKVPSTREGLSIDLDGEPLAEARWSMPIFLDPGDHEIVLRGRGKRTRTVTVQALTFDAMKSSQEVQLPTLEDDPNSGSNLPVAPAPAAPPSGLDARVLGIGAATGVALAAAAAGTYFGLATFDKRDAIGGHCVASRCDLVGAELQESAFSNATASTVSFSVAIASAATAVVLLLLPSPGERRSGAQLASQKLKAGPVSVLSW